MVVLDPKVYSSLDLDHRSHPSYEKESYGKSNAL
jgi:hypothetical protein